MEKFILPAIDGSLAIEIIYYEGRNFVILNSEKLSNVAFRLEDLKRILNEIETPKTPEETPAYPDEGLAEEE